MANVNLETKKIYGCSKGTLKYYHEEGHLKFEDIFLYGNLIRQMQNISLYFLIFIIGLCAVYPASILKSLVIILMLVNIFTEMWEEMWCWFYAKIKVEKKEDDERRKKRKDK